MQPAKRKIKILKAIVEAYIESGEPVGSKALCSLLDFPVSSATVRNEMAELSDMGYLTQPYTSAGRVPSENGYRYYVESLMEKKRLGSNERLFIDDALEESADDPEKLLSAAAQIVAKMANACVIVTAPSSESARIHSLKFVRTGRHTCMVVLISSSGLIKTKLFKCDYVITQDIVGIYETIFNRSMDGLPVKGITPAFVQTIAVEMGELAMLVPNVLGAIMAACSEVCNSGLTVAGRVNLLVDSETDLKSMRKLTSFLHSDESLEALVCVSRHKEIIIGSEIGFDALSDYSVLSVPYEIESGNKGYITAIVPMRSDYAYVESVAEYTADRVSKLLKNLLQLGDAEIVD